MHSRQLNYLNSNNSLVENQYDFRDKHSTFMALLQLVDDISTELDQKTILQEYLQIFSRHLIRSTIPCYQRNFSIMAYEVWLWTGSLVICYLSHRHQYANINDIDSSMLPVKWGSASSILYINDIVKIVAAGNIHNVS